MVKNNKGYIIPLVIALVYDFICFTGYEFMNGQNYLMFVLMILSIIGLMINILRGDDYIWNGDGKIIAEITGVLTVICARINSIEFFLDGTKYLGSVLAMILLAAFLWKYIKNADNKGKPAFYLIIAILVVCIIVTVITAVTFPKNEIRF